MTVKEFKEKSDLLFNFQDFAFAEQSGLGSDYRSLFEANRHSILDDFFDTLIGGLDQRNFSMLDGHGSVLMLCPFDKNLHGSIFLKAMCLVNSYGDNEFTNELLSYLWMLLDNLYHEQTYRSVEQDFIEQAGLFQSRLKDIKDCDPQYVDLLDQKLSYII